MPTIHKPLALRPICNTQAKTKYQQHIYKNDQIV